MTFEVGACHTPVPLVTPAGWVFYPSHNDVVRRLVVFVHGFHGGAVSTWLDFHRPPSDCSWWEEADLLFVGYDSVRENIGAVASRLRREMENFFPTPFHDGVIVGKTPVRTNPMAPYGELVLVGHSLGGVIIRRALRDAAELHEEGEPSPSILAASVRLFSPATAGFQAAGILGALRATSLWRALEVVLRNSSAYSDLQPGSQALVALQETTERLAKRPEFRALRARVVWANPDNVVVTERYSTDYVDTWWDRTSHVTVCKPRRETHELPWPFVEKGYVQ